MGHGHYVLNEQGEPELVESLLEWAARFDRQTRVIEQTTLPNGLFVSTVFLGLDHSFGEGPPVLFETMVFGGPENRTPIDDYQERYTSRHDALVGHAKACAEFESRLT